ncbi:MAG: SDR family oxidoreductase [Chitinophagaceae bacterium]
MEFFEEKVIWITGASSGIGAELARQLAPLKTRLILTARNEKALQKIAETCDNLGADCQLLLADLSKPETIETLCQKAIQAFGQIDILINNAGVTQRALTHETSIEIGRQIMELDYFAPIALTKYLLPHFKKNGGGQLVAISSMTGLMGFPQRSAYAAAKHAMKGFFETLQTERSIPNLSTTIAYPGRIHTPISYSAITKDGSAFGNMDEGQLYGIPVVDCAAKIIKGIQKKKPRIIIARAERILWWIWFYWLSLYLNIAHRKGS